MGTLTKAQRVFLTAISVMPRAPHTIDNAQWRMFKRLEAAGLVNVRFSAAMGREQAGITEAGRAALNPSEA